MRLPVIILGAGGHAKVLINALLASSREITGIVDPDIMLAGSLILGIPVLGGDEVVNAISPSRIELVNALGSIRLPGKRQKLYEGFKGLGYTFATVIHPSAVIALDVELGEGAQVMAGAVIQPGCSIGENSIINTSASVDHDCVIGDHVHIAPGVTLSGSVKLGGSSHIGTGATVIQGVCIGMDCLVGAGTLVLKDVLSGQSVIGVPARAIRG